MVEFFKELDVKILAALIAAITSIITVLITIGTKNFLEKNLHSYKLKSNYAYDQKRKIKDVIAQNKGHLLSAAASLNGRMKNLTSRSENQQWLRMHGDYNPEDRYYFKSFLYRILRFYAWIDILEKDLIYLDTAIAESDDMEFVKYLKVFPEIFHDGDLVENMGRTHDQVEHDLIYRDEFKNMYLWMINDNQKVISFNKFKQLYLENLNRFEKLCAYLDCIHPDEDRFRWDRICGLQLLVIGLLNKYGYDYQFTDKKYLKQLIDRQGKTRIFGNIKKHIYEKYKIKKKGLKIIFSALEDS
ncbi:MAG: hypothetical protein ACFB0A_04520 [Croceivirga sp.]